MSYIPQQPLIDTGLPNPFVTPEVRAQVDKDPKSILLVYFATSHSYYLIHSYSPATMIINDPNLVRPDPSLIPTGGFVLSLHPDGIALNRRKFNLPHVKMMSWGLTGDTALLGAELIKDATRGNLMGGNMSDVEEDFSADGQTMKTVSVRGYYKTRVKNRESLY